MPNPFRGLVQARVTLLARHHKTKAFSFMGSSLLSTGKSVMLGHLQQLAEIALHGSPAIGTAVEDLVLLVMHALAAERQADEVVFDKDELGRHVELLCMLATMERLRRRGLLSYASVISIELDADNSFVLSPDAFAQEDDMRRQVARGLH